MRNFLIPGWVWINLILLVAATILVWVKLAAVEKARRQKPGSKPVSAALRRTIK